MVQLNQLNANMRSAGNTRACFNQRKDNFRMVSSNNTSNIPYGYCHCGCGQKTKLHTKNNNRRGEQKGVPRRFLPFHQIRLRKPDPLENRFWSNVAITASPDECWEWQKSTKTSGYGQIETGGRKNRKSSPAHRVAWELTYGEIPDGLLVCHTCDNRLCCNPNHLFLGTHQDNMDDMSRKGRKAVLTGEQIATHKYTAEQVLKFREAYAVGDVSVCELARRFNVARSTMQLIIQRKTWKSVT